MKSRIHPASKVFFIDIDNFDLKAEVIRNQGYKNERVILSDKTNMDNSINISIIQWAKFKSLVKEIDKEWLDEIGDELKELNHFHLELKE